MTPNTRLVRIEMMNMDVSAVPEVFAASAKPMVNPTELSVADISESMNGMRTITLTICWIVYIAT